MTLTSNKCGANNSSGTLEFKRSRVTLVLASNGYSCANNSNPFLLFNQNNGHYNSFKLIVKAEILDRQGNDAQFTTCLDAWSPGYPAPQVYSQYSNAVIHEYSMEVKPDGTIDVSSSGSFGQDVYLFDQYTNSNGGGRGASCNFAAPTNRRFRIIARLYAPCGECANAGFGTTVYWEGSSNAYNNWADYEQNGYNIYVPLLFQEFSNSSPKFVPCPGSSCE